MIPLFEGQTFEKISTLPLGEYENCTFVGCDFSQSDLSQMKFLDSRFDKCNLSITKVMEAAMQNIDFTDCKLHGVDWSHCSSFLFEVHFTDSLLDFSSFSGIKMRKTEFKNCHIIEADFSLADLTESTFDRCDLTGSIFANTILEKVDFTTAYGYRLDPEQNKVKKARFSLE